MRGRWVRVAACDAVPPREGRAVALGGRTLALFNLGERFLAVDDRCPHRGGPLCDGIVSGSSVVCPLHSWKVDLETGAVARPADAGACVVAYPTRVENGEVLVLPDLGEDGGREIDADPELPGPACADAREPARAGARTVDRELRRVARGRAGAA